MDYKKIKPYTSGSKDAASCIDKNAIAILDLDYSNGRHGKELRLQNPVRLIIDIDYDRDFCFEAENQSDINDFHGTRHHKLRMFDNIISTDILGHLHNVWLSLRNSTAKLKHEGGVLITTPQIRHITAFCSFYFLESFLRNSRSTFNDSHLTSLTLSDGIQLCWQATLQVEKIVSRSGFFDSANSCINTFADKHCDAIASLRPTHMLPSYEFILIAKRAKA